MECVKFGELGSGKMNLVVVPSTRLQMDFAATRTRGVSRWLAEVFQVMLLSVR